MSGRITRSEVDEFRGRIGDKSALTTLYRPMISFAYEYKGVKYSGDHAAQTGKVTSNSASFAKKAVATYPAGKIIEVYVNPANPSEAMLKPGTGASWFVFAIGLGLLGLAYFVSQH